MILLSPIGETFTISNTINQKQKGDGIMGTYDYKQVISDYANGNITVEMAVGHSLQHIGKLYEGQTTANLSRYELRSKVDTLENMVNTLQTEIARLATLVKKTLPKRKQKSFNKPKKDPS